MYTNTRNLLPGTNDLALGVGRDTNSLVTGNLVRHKTGATDQSSSNDTKNGIGRWIAEPCLGKAGFGVSSASHATLSGNGGTVLLLLLLLLLCVCVCVSE